MRGNPTRNPAAATRSRSSLGQGVTSSMTGHFLPVKGRFQLANTVPR